MKLIIVFLCFFTTQIQAEEKPRLSMGFYYPSLRNLSTKTDIQISLNYWLQELTKSQNLSEVYTTLYEDIQKMSQDFNNRKLDMVIAPPLLLITHFDTSLFTNGFVGVAETHKPDQLLIITHQKNNESFVSYQGKNLTLPKDDLLAKVFLDSDVIKRYKQPYQKIFSQVSYVKKNKKMILDVFFDKVDVAVVYEHSLMLMMEMNPQLTKKIKVISKFPIKARNYGYFHKDYSHQTSLRNEIKQFSLLPKGKQILQVFHASNIAPCFVSDLERFDKLNTTYQQLLTSFK